MEYHAYLIVNVALAISCAVMSLIIMFFPLSEKQGLKNYLLSLRIMALAYFSVFLITVINLLLGKSSLNFPIGLIAISFQTVFIYFALIGLMNIQFIKRTYVLKSLTPTLIFVILIIVFEKTWGNPRLDHVDDFIPYYNHPTAILNMVFLLFCIVQLIYLSAVFIVEAKRYELKLYDYFADTYQLQLQWVRYYYYGAVAFCILVIGSLFFPSLAFSLVITSITMVFYTVFGLCYMQYPRTYKYIAPMMVTPPALNNDETAMNYRKLSWDNCKNFIIADKYYLHAEIDIEQMAQYLKIGRSTLSGYINREENMTFHAWINTLRIEEAKQIMNTHPDYSIAQVSDAVGFSEPSNFSRQFKHITHLSPLEWKQKQSRLHKKQPDENT